MFSMPTFSTRENGQVDICIIIVLGTVGDARVTIDVMNIPGEGTATGEEALKALFFPHKTTTAMFLSQYGVYAALGYPYNKDSPILLNKIVYLAQ